MDLLVLFSALLALIVFARVVAALKGRHGPWVYPLWKGSPAFASDGWNRAVKLTSVFGTALGTLILIGGAVSLIIWADSAVAWTLFAVGILAMYSRSLVIEFGFAFAEPANPGSDGKEAWEPRLADAPDFAAED